MSLHSHNLSGDDRNPKAETPSPKFETRRPKEGRNPKSESETSGFETEPSFWSWGELQADTTVILREDGTEHSPPRLDERTAQFGEEIIRFAKKIPQSAVNDRLISQLVGAATSVGANYCEADDS